MPGRERLRSQVTRVLGDIPIDFGGGCSASKGHVLAQLVRLTRTKQSIDIGVYRGRSFFPQALAHKYYTHGIAYGVDPYSAQEAKEVDNHELREQIDSFVQSTDFDALHADVTAFAHRQGLADHAVLVRDTSQRAAERFRAEGTRFGLVHVDGNHDTQAVMRDVADYLPLLAPGGFMVLDDVSWTSVKPATDEAMRHLTLVYARVDSWNDYAVLWNGRSRGRAGFLRAAIGWAGEG